MGSWLSSISSTTKLWLVVGLITLLVTSIGSAFWHISGLRADLATSEANSKTLNDAVQEQKAAIDGIQANIVALRAATQRLNALADQQEQSTRRLEQKFNGSPKRSTPRDIGRLAVAKPEAIQVAVNHGSRDAARCLEIATGAELTEEELSADLPSKFNSICPELANPRSKL